MLRPVGRVRSVLRDPAEAPRQGDEGAGPASSVFSTRSPDRPNPIGLHRVRLTLVAEPVLEVDALEAVDGTPVLDIKPVLEAIADR